MIPPFVYFLQPVTGGPIKIGCSLIPENRLVSLMAWSPHPLKLLAKAPGSMALEGELHKRFKAHRSHGEWFRPAPELLALIDEVIATGVVPGVPAGIDPLPPPPKGRRYRSRLHNLLPTVSASEQDLATALGLGLAVVRSWREWSIPDRHVPGTIRFFAARGVEITNLGLHEVADPRVWPVPTRASGAPWRVARYLDDSGLAYVDRGVAAQLGDTTFKGLDAAAFSRIARALNDRLRGYHSGSDVSAIAVATGLEKALVQKAIRRLRDWRLVERGGGHSYRFTEGPEDACQSILSRVAA